MWGGGEGEGRGGGGQQHMEGCREKEKVLCAPSAARYRLCWAGDADCVDSRQEGLADSVETYLKRPCISVLLQAHLWSTHMPWVLHSSCAVCFFTMYCRSCMIIHNFGQIMSGTTSLTCGSMGLLACTWRAVDFLNILESALQCCLVLQSGPNSICTVCGHHH